MCITVCNTHTHTRLCRRVHGPVLLPGVCTKERFPPDGVAPGTLLQINDELCFYYSADSSKCSVCGFSYLFCPSSPFFFEKYVCYLLYPVVLMVLLGGGIKGGWDKSNKRRKKMGKPG